MKRGKNKMTHIHKSNSNNKVRTKKKIVFRHLISPDLQYFGLANLEVLFGTFKWMAQTGHPYKGMNEALSGHPTCINFREIEGFGEKPVDELIKRFSIILNSSLIKMGVIAWKKKYMVGLHTSRVMPMRYNKVGYWLNNIKISDEYKKLFEVCNKRNFIQPQNEVHPECTLINGVSFHIKNISWEVPDCRYEIKYFYSDAEGNNYTWNKNYISEVDETLFDFCQRANADIRKITKPVKVSE